MSPKHNGTSMKLPPALKPGEDVRFDHDGAWYHVVRTTPGAAYVLQLYTQPRRVDLPDGRSFMANSGSKVEAVSLHSFTVERRQHVGDV